MGRCAAGSTQSFLRVCAALFFLTCATHAVDLPAIRLDSIYPPGGQAGTEVSVVITGADLDDAKSLHFSHFGFTATSSKETQFVIKISPEVPPGIYDVRVSGLFGVSNPRAFVVGLLPESIKSKPSDKPETALEFPINSVVTGTAAAAAADYFKFSAKQGQRLLTECAALEIDSKLLPVLAILDATGRELESSRRGGFLDFTAPADGTFLLRLQDLAYAGGPAYAYRLSLTTGPHLDFAMPVCSETGKFTLYGRNLPGGIPAKLAAADGKPLEQLKVKIEPPGRSIPAPAKPEDGSAIRVATPQGDPQADGLLAPAGAAVNGLSYRLNTPQGVSNPIFVPFPTAPLIAEVESNNSAVEAQKITVPCEISGQFYPAADVDCFTFAAKKNDVFLIEVTSQRLGLPTNPFLLVQREGAEAQEVYAAEAPATEKRFITSSNDPIFILAVKEDGNYFVTVRDLFGGARRDPRNTYRLSIRAQTYDFGLLAAVEPAPEKADDRTAVPRAALLRGGGTTAIKIIPLRPKFAPDNFPFEIQVLAEGLPEGVTSGLTSIRAGDKSGLLLLTAQEKVPHWVGPIRIVGRISKATDAKSQMPEPTGFETEAHGGAIRYPITDFNTDTVSARLTRDFVLAVSDTESAPVSIEPVEKKDWEVAAGGKLDIPLKITRRGEFKEPLKLKAAGAPGLETAKELDVEAAAQTATAMLDFAAAKVPPGWHTVYFTALTKGKFRGKDVITTIYSTPIRLELKAPPPK